MDIPSAIGAIRDGKMVIVVDEEDRENEGDLTMAAEKVTPEAVNFMATFGRGLICLPMTGDRLDELKVPLMVNDGNSPADTAFCVSIEARRNVSTGISAADRAMTILTAIDPQTRGEDLMRPGHVFPLRARRGGVLERAGQTEAAVDLARLAGLKPAGVICEIMNEDGSMARRPDLEEFSAAHGVGIVTVVDLIHYRHQTERFVHRIETAPYESELGRFVLHLYRNDLDGGHHLAFVKGDISGSEPVLTRMHAASVLNDVFLSRPGQGVDELRRSLGRIEGEGRGVLVYLRLRDKESSLRRDFHELSGQPPPPETTSVGFRDFGVGAQILADLGLTDVRVLTNHPKKLVALEGFGINIVEQMPIE